MLEKTLALLDGIKRGESVDDEVACYDEAELRELGRVLSRLVYAPPKLRKVLQEMGATLSSAGSSSETASAEQPRLTALPAVAVNATLREHARFTAPGSAYEEFDRRILEGCPRLSSGKPPLVAAFYLPQFHPILENDAFWGRGFTEWRQLPRGIPRFRDHYQPRIPRDLGFYNQTDQDTIRRQAEMARAAGIGAFAYYYYRFGRKRVLDAPLELLLESDIEMPFFLIWANESWTRRWDGSENDILLKQDYRAEDESALLADLARHMRDWRYLRLDGRPLLVIYNPGHIPNCAEAVARWREAWRIRHRLDPLIFMAQTFGHEDPREFGFDGALEFPPNNLSTQIDDCDIEPFSADFKGRVIKYDDLAAASLAKPMADFPLVKTLVPNWDNEPRRPNRGLVVRGSTPAAYQAWLEALVERAMERPVHGTPLVAVNAWNEWAEGAYLEPDIHFGGAYLNATARGINAAVSARYARESAPLRAPGPGLGRPTVFLHMGLHKTGTTSIQVALCRLRGQLADEGTLYPRTACPDFAYQGQHLLPWSLVEEDSHYTQSWDVTARLGGGERDAVWDKLHEEISQSKAGTVIISSEEFDTLGPAAIEALGRKLDRYDVVPVLCARRTSAVKESSYRTVVASMGYKSGIGDFVREDRCRTDLHNMVRDWRSIALDGTMKIIAYDDPEIGGDIVQTFLHVVGLERLADWMGPQARQNTSPPAFICEILRELRTQGAAEADIERALEQFSNIDIRIGARGAYTCLPLDLEMALDEDYRLQIERLVSDPETNTMWIGKPPASFEPSAAQPVTAFAPAILALVEELSRRAQTRRAP